MKSFIQIIFFIILFFNDYIKHSFYFSIYFHATRINEELKILFKHGTGKNNIHSFKCKNNG